MTKQPDPISPEGTPPLPPEGYLTAKEAAERMGLSVETVRAMCSDGVLPDALRDHDKGSWRIPVQAVETWLARQNNTPQPKTVPTSAALPPTPFWRLIVMIGAIAGILGLVSVIANSLNIADRMRIALAKPTPLPFERAKADETLILIASFDHTEGVADTDIQREIQRAIEQAADELQTPNLRVEVEPTHLKADDQSGAEALGKQYDASIVIWGADTGVRVTVNFLNLKHPDFDAARTQINETQRTQIADPETFASFVTRDLPSQLSFLALFAVGQSYYAEGEYGTAVSVIERGVVALVSASELPEGLAEAYYRLGWLYQTSGNQQQAIDAYTKTIELQSDYAKAYNNRGIARKSQGDIGGAIADYDNAIELNPKSAETYYNRGNAKFSQGNESGAIADYDKAIELNPDYGFAYYNRGLARSNQSPRVVFISPPYILAPQPMPDATFPTLAVTCGDFSTTWRFDLGDLTTLSDFDMALKLSPELAEAYVSRGRVKVALNDLDNAILDYDTAIKLRPDLPEPYFRRGIARWLQGRFDEAITDYSTALALKPNYVEAFVGLGEASCSDGRFRDAQAAFAKAVELQSNEMIQRDAGGAFQYRMRGMAQYLQGSLTGAIADFRRYLELWPNAPDRQQIEQWIAELEQQLNNP